MSTPMGGPESSGEESVSEVGPEYRQRSGREEERSIEVKKSVMCGLTLSVFKGINFVVPSVTRLITDETNYFV